MEIKIGADEIILWLRKNKKAKEETTKYLGLKIRKLMESIGGRLIIHDEKCYWNTEKILKSIDEFELPMTSSQYTIDSNKLGDLYNELNNW